MRPLVGILCALLAVGCNEVEATRPVSVTVEVLAEATALQGVAVCDTDEPYCVTTDASGKATLELPANEPISYTLEKYGYEAKLFADVTDGAFGSVRQHSLWTDERAADWYETVEGQYPLSGVGTVHVSLQPPFEGATFDLEGATGTAFYDEIKGDTWASSVDLAATTSEGSGGFLSVGPGEFQIEFGGTASRCVSDQAWPGGAENRIGFPVREGFITVLTVKCQVPP